VKTKAYRPWIALLAGLAVIGGLAVGVARLVESPAPKAGAPRGERLYLAYCAHCHGADGRGSWWATVTLLRPGDFTDRTRMAGNADPYLFEIIKHGGSPLGRPGMPGFEHLGDADVEALVRHVRSLSK